MPGRLPSMRAAMTATVAPPGSADGAARAAPAGLSPAAGCRRGARFAMTQAINYRRITPGVSVYATTPSHLSVAVNASRPRNSQFPRQFPRFASLTATELITVCPCTFPSPAAFPASALAARQPPRSHALTWPHASRGRAGTGLRARTRGEYLIVHGYNAAGRRPGLNVRYAPAARHSLLFYRLDLHRVRESTRMFILATSCVFTAARALRCRQVDVLAGRFADDVEGRHVREPG